MILSFEESTSLVMKEKVAQILKRIDEGDTIVEPNIVLSNVTVVDLDFRSSNLTYMVAVETKLESCDLKHTDLSGLDYRGGSIQDTSFLFANLVKASIYSCDLDRVNFKNCDFSRSEFTDVIFNDVSFENANLIGASFDNCDLRGVNFEMAIFDRTHFFGCLLDEKVKTLPGAVLKGALN